jgi:hypothetical protein
MKNLVSFLFGVVIFLVSAVNVAGQHVEFYDIPAIYSIDEYEQANHITASFYTAWENGTVSTKTEKWYKLVLETKFMAFTMNGWLYTLSYEPVSNSHNIEDYKNVVRRRVYLYKKNVRTGGDWELDGINSIFSHTLINSYSDGYSFQSARDDDKEPYEKRVIKSGAYNGVVFLLCKINNTCNGSNNPLNLVIALTPSICGGSSCHNVDKWFNQRLYPSQFIGTTDGGKTILTYDNYNKERKIRTLLGGTANGKELSTDHVSYDGDYGWMYCNKN